MSLRIALTGGIGSGKTAVSARFAALGAPVIDSDRIAREIVAPGEPGLEAIRDTWGQRFLAADGSLKRRALRAAAFSDPAIRQRLDELLHPLIRERLERQAENADAPYVLLVIPLLLEAGFIDLAERVLLVSAARETRIQRVMRRDGESREAVEAILASQAPEAARRRIADEVIDNDGPPARLDEQVRALHRFYLELAQREFTPPVK